MNLWVKKRHSWDQAGESWCPLIFQHTQGPVGRTRCPMKWGDGNLSWCSEACSSAWMWKGVQIPWWGKILKNTWLLTLPEGPLDAIRKRMILGGVISAISQNMQERVARNFMGDHHSLREGIKLTTKCHSKSRKLSFHQIATRPPKQTHREIWSYYSWHFLGFCTIRYLWIPSCFVYYVALSSLNHHGFKSKWPYNKKNLFPFFFFSFWKTTIWYIKISKKR